jgi:hypothetical protein
LSFCLPRLALTDRRGEEVMRFIGLDVHREFCEVAVAEKGRVRLAAE